MNTGYVHRHHHGTQNCKEKPKRLPFGPPPHHLTSTRRQATSTRWIGRPFRGCLVCDATATVLDTFCWQGVPRILSSFPNRITISQDEENNEWYMWKLKISEWLFKGNVIILPLFIFLFISSLCILRNMLLEIQTVWHFRLALVSIVKRMYVGYLAEGNY